MKIKFLGGAEEVGRLGIKMTEGENRFLVDYGVIPEKPPEYPLPPEKVDGIFLTHSHLDHAGSLPVYFQKYAANFYATLMTANSVRPMLNDSIKVASLEGYPQPFSKDDISLLYNSFQNLEYGDEHNIGDFSVTGYSAGHIPGSTMWHFQNSESVLVTGDLYTRQTNLLDGAKPVKADTLIMESTYAGRDHEDRQAVIQRLRSRVMEVVESGGKVIFPTFAMGRTQELIMILDKLDLNISVDGMGNLISEIYLETPGFLRSQNEFRRALGRVRKVRGPRHRERALEESDIIITTSGMMDGGPVLGYVEQLLEDTSSAIFLTGYQVENTNGRSLMENGSIDIAGVNVKPKTKIEFFDLSAHAGHSDLVKFVKSVDPSTVILCHGDSREELLPDLSEYRVILPLNGREFDL
ncbi:MAG: MBL fold metallo-hydrolase [Candidatus Thermoplasmatota archaeon]|nr:MBL fold metallo-hydrolase [Candidatus Thermoplasmatota archaeon]MCL5731245.1 MBL fold metallo-hydrolase [Candidatus Thermoplasmatota archaeon]